MVKRMVAVALLSMVVLSGCGGENAPEPDPTESSALEPEAHLDASEFLTVGESGFTTRPGEDGTVLVSYAILLTNENPDYAAYQVGVDVGWVDVSGEPVEVLPPAGGPVREHDPLWIPPGAMWVLADVVEVSAEPVDFELTFTEEDTFNRWFAYERLSGVGEVTVSEATMRDESDRESAESWEAVLTVDSTFDTSLNAVDPVAVFRDVDGTVVGGSRTYGAPDASIDHGANEVVLATPEATVPDDVDPGQTEFFMLLTWSTVWEPTLELSSNRVVGTPIDVPTTRDDACPDGAWADGRYRPITRRRRRIWRRSPAERPGRHRAAP